MRNDILSWGSQDTDVKGIQCPVTVSESSVAGEAECGYCEEEGAGVTALQR